MTAKSQYTQELVLQLSEAQATIAALVSGQVDAVVDADSQTPVLLFRAQAALCESEERYRRIVEATNEGVWAIDIDFKTTFINARMAAMLGYEVAAMIGRTPMEFLDPEGLAAFAAFIEGHRAAIPVQLEVRFVRRDGTGLWVLLGASPIFDADGRFDGSLAMLMDVTNRKRIEGELRVLETLIVAASSAPDLSAVFKVVLQMICELTGWAYGAAWIPQPETSTLICSRLWTRDPGERTRFASLGTSPFSIGEGVVGRACASRAPVWVNDLATEPDCSRSATAAGLGIHAGLVVPVVYRDTVIAVIEFFMTAPGQPDARFVKLVSAAAAQLASTMARKTAESLLVERVRVAALGSDVGLALMKGGAIEDTLRHCAEAMVWNLDAALARIWTLRRPGRDLLELRASAGLLTTLDGYQACVPVGKLEIGLIAEHRRLHVTNDIQNDPWIADRGWAQRKGLTAFAGFPLIVADELVGVISIFARHPLSGSTIDGLSSIADAIALALQHNLVEQAKTALEAQLLHAQKMEAVGRLAGGIAHDFNNLLSIILSYGELMVEDLKPGEPMREYSEEICKAGRRAAALTSQLLMFSRQRVVEPRVLDLNDVLTGMAKMVPRILGADIDLVSLRADGLGRVRIDRGSIEQVIMNLVVNARDAMPTGGKLTVETANVVLDDDYARTHVGVKPGPHVMLAIGDTGHGMDAATQSHIFEPFFTTKPPGKGTGLGLATVFGIVHQGGGSVWVDSGVGRGTTVKVLLPQVTEPLNRAPPGELVRTSLRGTETILLVEDDEQVRAAACDILRRYGYHVIAAGSPGDAILLCERAEVIHLLLTDVVMPQMSGPVLARRLAKSRPEMKLLYMSGHIDDSVVRHGVYEGGAAFLQKPITPDLLANRVRDLLDERQR